MIGIAGYDSDEEEAPAAPAAPKAAAPKAAAPKAAAPKAAAPKGAAPKAKAGTPRPKPIPAARLKELRKEILGAKSATGVVQVARKACDTTWDVRWGAEALYQIAKRSTARTRKEWGGDPFVRKLAEKLRAEVASVVAADKRQEGDVDSMLVALEGLRRLTFQDPDEQKEALEKTMTWVVADKWHHSVRSLSRLLWLSAPLKLKGSDGWTDLPGMLRSKAPMLEGTDVALVLAGMQHAGSRDDALLEKVVAKLAQDGIFSGLSATDLVEIAEGMKALEATEERPLRLLGQEILRRRGELTPDESHRVHSAYSDMKLPLPKVWTEPGATKKRDGAQIVTTTAFAPQEGHEKKRRGNHDIERTSPPRVVRDMKMMSY